MKYLAINQTMETIVMYLRSYFNDINNYKMYLPPQINPEHYSILSENIFSTDPEKLRTFPLMLISSNGGEIIPAGIGGDIVGDMYNVDTNSMNMVYGGIYNLQFTLEIATRTTLDRDVLTDIVAEALRFTLRRSLENYGIIIKNVRYSGNTSEPYDSNKVYISSLNIDTHTEYYKAYDPITIDTVKLNLKL